MISHFTLHPSLFFPMLAPYKGRVYNPCCGSVGMCVQCEEFVEVHVRRIGTSLLTQRLSGEIRVVKAERIVGELWDE